MQFFLPRSRLSLSSETPCFNYLFNVFIYLKLQPKHLTLALGTSRNFLSSQKIKSTIYAIYNWLYMQYIIVFTNYNNKSTIALTRLHYTVIITQWIWKRGWGNIQLSKKNIRIIYIYRQSRWTGDSEVAGSVPPYKQLPQSLSSLQGTHR